MVNLTCYSNVEQQLHTMCFKCIKLHPQIVASFEYQPHNFFKTCLILAVVMVCYISCMVCKLYVDSCSSSVLLASMHGLYLLYLLTDYMHCLKYACTSLPLFVYGCVVINMYSMPCSLRWNYPKIKLFKKYRTSAFQILTQSNQ